MTAPNDTAPQTGATWNAVLVRVARLENSTLPEYVAGLSLADVPGLAITPSVFAHGEWRWTITHLASGWAVTNGRGLFYIQQAAAVMRRIGAFTDWTQDRFAVTKIGALGARICAVLDDLEDMAWAPVTKEPGAVDGLPDFVPTTPDAGGPA